MNSCSISHKALIIITGQNEKTIISDTDSEENKQTVDKNEEITDREDDESNKENEDPERQLNAQLTGHV